ncbi:hypothetical protein KTH71_11330 [Acinetobacter sp. WU_MDCI_Axc73]|nr:hypothetical protein [Acinetobacter sp. WU_MDCI_Axc73]
MGNIQTLRQRLIKIALEWEQAFGNAPSITPVISEYDAAQLLGIDDITYSQIMQNSTSVQRGHDFIYQGLKYQVKGTRPSGKKGSKITKVPSAKNYEWDYLLWISYNSDYSIAEAWKWDMQSYRLAFEHLKRISPVQMRNGSNLL